MFINGFCLFVINQTFILGGCWKTIWVTSDRSIPNLSNSCKIDSQCDIVFLLNKIQYLLETILLLYYCAQGHA